VWIKNMLVNLKTTLDIAYHAFDFNKCASRYLVLIVNFCLSDAKEFNDLELIAKTTISDSIVKNKPLLDMKWSIFAFMICTVFFMWAYWYKEAYDWSDILESFEAELETFWSSLLAEVRDGFEELT
jgi:hypothetical protein